MPCKLGNSSAWLSSLPVLWYCKMDNRIYPICWRESKWCRKKFWGNRCTLLCYTFCKYIPRYLGLSIWPPKHKSGVSSSHCTPMDWGHAVHSTLLRSHQEWLEDHKFCISCSHRGIHYSSHRNFYRPRLPELCYPGFNYSSQCVFYGTSSCIEDKCWCIWSPKSLYIGNRTGAHSYQFWPSFWCLTFL